MSEKVRLDALLVQRGLVESRDKAKAVIMGGHVILEGDREDKPGRMVSPDARVELRGYEKKYVSRGGYKLEKALLEFGIDLQGALCIDAGASTGGFTDCMLQNGAKKVYAVDVGYGQLAWSLRTDERVVCMERTNVRYLDAQQISEQVDFVSIDVSFISLSLVVPPLAALLREGGQMVALVKPQFETAPNLMRKNKGVIRDEVLRREALDKILAFVSESFADATFIGSMESPIKGGDGNVEYLIGYRKA